MTWKLPYSPLEKINADYCEISLYLKRDDLVHPTIEGNKWRKLKYNLKNALANRINTLVSVGGAYSNHLLALSQAGKHYGLKTQGYIYGSHADVHNYTLRACRNNGMEIFPIAKSLFEPYKKGMFVLPPDAVFIPEGGSNMLALEGCRELYLEIEDQLPDVTHIVLPFGSGGTTAGIYLAKKPQVDVLALPILKLNPVEHLSRIYTGDFSGLKYSGEYHFGGYARFNDELLTFIKAWHEKTGIVIDPVYNGKALFALCDLVEKKYFPEGSKVVYIHTGGSQGICGFNERYNCALPERKY
ncbi:MAG: pyridoxal-phosphate dependent enzyme [Saprospiraceae bacterium]|nr:pyridoxal-phosphate dependent enzyme [Saprospiraceae bacterium]